MNTEKMVSGLGITAAGVGMFFVKSYVPESMHGSLVSFGWLTVFIGILIAAWGYLEYG